MWGRRKQFEHKDIKMCSLHYVILNGVVDVLLHVADAFLSQPDQCAFNSSVTATYQTVYWQCTDLKSETKVEKRLNLLQHSVKAALDLSVNQLAVLNEIQTGTGQEG